MSENIHFRAWDKKNKKMRFIIGMTFYDDNGGGDYEIDSVAFEGMEGRELQNWRVNQYSGLMQYIGRKDKNGLEIYQGDVVRYDGTIWQVGRDELSAGFTLFTVHEGEEENYIYSSGVPIRDFQWISSKNEKGSYTKGLNLKTMDVDDIEVVGNIYEDERKVKDE